MTISLYAPGELMVTLEIAYMVTGVAWKPAYDIRVNSNRPQISLTYYGLVKQATGEDWEGVKLVLTTADSATVAVRLAFARVCVRVRVCVYARAI